MLTGRFRRALASHDSGAVAIVVAILSIVLFGIAALAIDIGQLYVRRSSAQLDADLAALAGAQALPNPTAARQLAYNYISENFPASGGSAGPLSNYGDGNGDNGEITITNNNTRIRVLVPRTVVSFGMAAALGFSSSTTNAAATAEIRSPAGAIPFMASEAVSSGYLCLKDSSGGQTPSAMRAALLAAQPAPKPPTINSITPTQGPPTGGTSVVIAGKDLGGATSVTFDGVPAASYVVANNGNRIDAVTPAHAAGSVIVEVTTDAGTAVTAFTYVTPPPTPAPTVTSVTPASGDAAGGNAVTIAGTNLAGATAVDFGTTPATSFTVVSATQITAIAPAGSGLVDVRVTTPGGTSAVSPGDQYTYLVDSCTGANGNFSFLDVPRTDVTGANTTLKVNIIEGLESTISTFPTAQLPALDTPCQSGNTTIAGAILNTNCLDVENGNKISVTADAYLTGNSNPDLDARLLDPPSGHDQATIFGHDDLDADHLGDYLTVPLADFVNAISGNATATPGWIDPDILQCPRFSIVPVLHTSAHPPNGYYPVVGFRGVFIDGPAPEYGFTPNNNATQIASIKAYAFSLDYLPGVVSSSDAGDTTTYVGSGPKVPVLVE